MSARVRIPSGAIDTVVWIGHVSRNLIRVQNEIFHIILTGSIPLGHGFNYMLHPLSIPWQKTKWELEPMVAS